MSQFPRFLFINLLGLGNQGDLEFFLRKGRLRDQSTEFHQTLPPDFTMNYIVGNLIAEIFNLTLITDTHPLVTNDSGRHWNCCQIVVTNFPQLISPVQTFGGLVESLKLWNCFYNSTVLATDTTEHPVFVKKESYLYNFVYCSVRRTKFESTWNFRIFMDPFDVWTWLALSMLLLWVSTVVSISTRYGLFLTFLSCLASLLDNEMRRFSGSKLYVLWLFATLLIVDFYSGAITSEVIAPPEEIRLTSLSDLEEQNFSLIFPHPNPADEVNISVSRNDEYLYEKENFKILKRLMKRSQVISGLSDLFWETLTGDNPIAAVLGYCYALWFASLGNGFISNHISKKVQNKKCHVGLEMVDVVGERFLVFTPPRSVEMASMFSKLEASGIIPRWDQEAKLLMYAGRVQDRSKVISRTMMAKELETVHKLQLEGKMLTIFYLWALGIILSCNFASHEILMRYMNRSMGRAGGY